MNMRTGIALCALVALTAPVDTAAQGVGGRLRQRVEQAMGQDKKTDETQSASSPFNETVIEITAPVLAGFMNGLDEEIRLLYEFGKLLSTYRAPDDYAVCQTGVAATPEGQKIAAQFASLPANATAEDIQRVSEKMGREMTALSLKACGPDPAEWDAVRRKEKVAEIQRKAAAVAGPVGSPAPKPPGGPSAMDSTAIMESAKERTAAYCPALEAGAIQPGQAVKGFGTGNDTLWVFTEEEGKAIPPKCADLTKKQRIVLEMGEIVIQPARKITLEMLDVIIRSN